MKIGFPEVILIQLLLYATIYFFNAYVGFLLCVVIPVIALAIIVLSVILEMVERSRVPIKYYQWMASAVICPVLVLILFLLLDPDALSWIDK